MNIPKKIIFNEITFGPLTKFALNADTVSFINCVGLSSLNTLLSINPKSTCLGFYDTDFSSVNMTFAEFNFVLPFKSGEFADGDSNLEKQNQSWRKDVMSAMYETAISKSKREGKAESYKKVSIEFKHYKYSSMWILGKIFSGFEMIWWNYGFSRVRIFLWTGLLLLVFFFFNDSHWVEINSVYPIMSPEKTLNSRKDDKKINAFLFTCYVFFILHIDVNNIKTENKLMLRWFFFQYLIGLFCLFFIVNYVLKA